jgi:hypothetical protein
MEVIMIILYGVLMVVPIVCVFIVIIVCLCAYQFKKETEREHLTFMYKRYLNRLKIWKACARRYNNRFLESVMFYPRERDKE